MLTFQYTGAKGIMTVEETITTGMRGKQVVLEFSTEWEGLAKTVVFSNGEKTRDVVFGGNPVTIPAEILEEPLKQLTVGVYGVGDRGELAIPTVRALGPVILPGALPSGEAAGEPVIPFWEQVYARLGDLSQLDTETKESLVAAINEILEKYGKLMNPDKTLTLEGAAADAKAVGDALTRYFTDFKGVFLVTASDQEADRSAGEILAAAEMGMLPVLYVVHADGAFFAPLFRFREETALFEVPGMEAGTATLMTFAVDEAKHVTVTMDYQTNSGTDQGPAGVIGAVGDGVADDTLAFRAALASNRVVCVPGGTYKLSGELVIGDNCCLELSQDTVLEFTQTSGNCITLGMLSTLKGNHATVKVPYAFDGHVLHAYSNDHTDAEAQAVQPWSKWDPQWKSGRYVSDLNICKADSRGFHYAVNADDCKGTAVYISADNTAGMLTFMWGIRYSGLRIAGAFAYGIHAQNFDSGWVHEMRIDAFIDACEVGVCLEDCNNTYISATIQPRRAYTEDKSNVPYAKHGIKLIRSKNTDLSGSRVWDWSAAYTLWTQDNEYQHIAMYGDCSGTILNDFSYHSQGDTRKRIYTDNDHNLETVTILQEPIDRWFKVIGGEPYYTDGLTNQRLLREDALDTFVDVDFVKNFTDVLATATEADGVTVFNEIGYQVGKRFTSLGTGTDLTDSTYYMTTGFIRISLGSTIYGRGLHFDDTAKSYAGIVYYNANRERVASMTIANVVQGDQYYVVNYTRTSDGFSVQIPSSVTLSNLNATYVRLVFPMSCVGEYPMLSIDEEIKYTVESFLADSVKVKGENVIGNVEIEVSGSSQNVDACGKKWLFIGDSITEHNFRATKNYDQFLAEWLGIVSVNRGMSSTGVTHSLTSSPTWLTDLPNYPDDVDCISVMGALNDRHTTLGAWGDRGTDTVYGGVWNYFDRLITKYPNKPIIYITSTPREYSYGVEGQYTAWVDAFIKTAHNFSIPVLDLYRESGLRPWNATNNKTYFSCDSAPNGDGVHPNELGQELMARKIYDFAKVHLFGLANGGPSGDNTGEGDNTGGGSGEDTHTHSYTSSVTKAATCTTAGVRTYTCSCGHSYTEIIPATGHTYVDGVCTVCGDVVDTGNGWDAGDESVTGAWELGALNNGANAHSTTRIRTVAGIYLSIYEEITVTFDPAVYKVAAYYLSAEGGQSLNTASYDTTGEININSTNTPAGTRYMRLVLARVDDANMTVDEASAVSVTATPKAVSTGVVDTGVWELGAISTGSGWNDGNVASETRIRTFGFIRMVGYHSFKIVFDSSIYKMAVYYYSEATTHAQTALNVASYDTTGEININSTNTPDGTRYMRLVLARVDDANITVDEASAVTVTGVVK